MGCPRCNGLQRVPSADGNFQCTTPIIVAVVPPGLVPGPAGQPVYGPCHWIFSPADERAADAARAEAAARHAAELAERARETAAVEDRHRQKAAENERRHGPAGPIRDRIAALDGRLERSTAWPEGEDWALGGLLIGLAGAYLLAARRVPSPVGGAPGWLPSFFLTMPGWVLVLVTVAALGGGLVWAAAFLRRAAHPDPGLGGLAGLGVATGSFATYLASAAEPPDWLPSFLVMSDRWTVAVVAASAAAVVAWLVVHARRITNRRAMVRIRARRDDLRTRVGCGNPRCDPCTTDTPFRWTATPERFGDIVEAP